MRIGDGDRCARPVGGSMQHDSPEPEDVVARRNRCRRLRRAHPPFAVDGGLDLVVTVFLVAHVNEPDAAIAEAPLQVRSHDPGPKIGGTVRIAEPEDSYMLRPLFALEGAQASV